MKKTIAALSIMLAAGFAAMPAEAAGVKVGVLKCHVKGGVGFIVGSSKSANCEFSPAGGGRIEHYKGTMGRLGVDIGATGEAVLGWVVFAPGKLKNGALKGSYTGAGAEATVGLGLGANVLVGGFKKGINLQPVSVQAQTGLNVAAGVASLTLKPVKSYYKN